MLENIFDIIIKTITNTPIWVMGVFIYLIFIGVKSMRNRIISLPSLFIMPAIFIGMKYRIFNLENISLILTYLLCVSFGSAIGFATCMKTKIIILKARRSIEFPANYYTICIIFIFFIMKYFYGYLSATNPELAFEYFRLETSVSGVFSGYFLGIAISCLYRYLKS